MSAIPSYAKSIVSKCCFLFLPLSLTAPVFYSLEGAPHYLQLISRFNPFAYHVEAMREVFIEGRISLSFYLSLVMALVFFLLAERVMKRAEFLPTER